MLQMRYTLFLIISLLFSTASIADNFYWIGDSGNFNDSQNWSNSASGTGGYGVPGSEDKAFIYYNKTEPLLIHLASNTYLKELHTRSLSSLKFTTSNKSLFINNQLEIFSNLISEANIVLNGTQTTLNFHSFLLDGTLEVKGTLNLESAVNLGNKTFKCANGAVLNALGATISCGDFIVENGVSQVSLNNSTLNLGGNLVVEPGANMTENSNIVIVQDPDFNSATVLFDNSDVIRGTNPCSGGTVTAVATSNYNGAVISCNGSSDGEITVTVVGVAGGPFLYDISPPLTTDLGASNVFPGLPAGSYSFRIFRASDSSLVCVGQENLVEPFPIDPLIFQQRPAKCYDSCNAVVTYQIIGGTPNFSVIFPNSGLTERVVGVNPFGTIGGLCAGDNPYTITDTNNCISNGNVMITQPDSISTTFQTQDPNCNGDCNGWVSTAPFGGNGSNYTFLWTPNPAVGQGTDSISSLCAGNYSVHIEDDSLCFNDFSISIADPPIFQAQLAGISDVKCFGICDGSIAAQPLNGTGPYTFQWLDDLNNPIGNTDSIATGLCPGNYKVVVTDANGCFDTTAIGTILEPTDLTSGTSSVQPSCFGILDGSVSVVAAGGTPAYSYEWFNGLGALLGASPTINGLGAGTFQVIVTDANNCKDTSVVITLVFPDSLHIVLNAYPPTCYDLCNGSVGATVTGGTPPYAYLWAPAGVTGNGTDSITNLCPGTYNLSIADAKSCFKFASALVDPVALYSITKDSTNLTCNGANDGTIDLTVNSGADGGPYSVIWAPIPPAGQQGNFNLIGLAAGLWTATISDGLGCDTVITFKLSQPNPITVVATVNSTATCFNDCDGAASTVVAGGQGLVTYAWNDPASQTTPNVVGLCAGQYIVTVVDAAMCTHKDTITITEPNQITFDTSSTVPSCFNICDATATVSSLAGGTGILSVQWSDPLNQTTPTAIGLCGGTIDVTITDQNTCDTTITLTIPTPDAILAPITSNLGSCFGACSGQGYLDISGGTPGYNVAWFNAVNGVNLGVNNDTIPGLCPGKYTARVTDAGGCILKTDTITIIELPELLISVNSFVDATCGLCDGQGDVSVSGGSGGLTVTWNPAPASGATGLIKNDLCEGIYIVTVRDAAGCSKNVTITINGIANELITMDSTDVSCFNVCDGTATASYVCGVPACTITWFDDLGASIGQTGDVATGLCPGTYTAQLENGGGCFAYQSVTINSAPAITASVNTFSDPTCNGLCDGEIILTQAGGTGALTTTWTPLPLAGQGTNHAEGLCDGWQVYSISDANGCTIKDSLELSDNPVLNISNFNTTDISCFGNNNGTASIAPVGGVPNYSVEWFNCTGVTTGLTGQLAINLAPGSYYAQVTDDAGCIKNTPCDSVRPKTPLKLIIDSNVVSCSGICDGQLIASISGGTPNYFYQWLNAAQVPILGETNDTLSNICSGTFYLRVTDLNACDSIYGPFTLSAPVPWDVTIVSDSASCNGIADGKGKVTVNSGNTAPYSYLWNPSGIVNPIAAPLAAGTYNVTITDASGACDTTVQVVILQPAPLKFNPNISPISCFDACDGGIDLSNISGGTPSYSLLWNLLPGSTSISNKCPGVFNIRVIDSKACFKDTVITLTEPTEINANLVANMATCSLCNGSSTANPTGGSGSYSYNWNPGPVSGQGTQNVTNLCANLYSLIVTDNSGCADTTTFAIDNVNADVLTMSADSASCFEVCDGAAFVSYNCSVANCSQQWFLNNAFNNVGVVDTTVQNACAGVYYAFVTNGAGCISIDSIRVGEPAEILANDTVSTPICFDAADGKIVLAPSGGSGSGYVYNWTPVPGSGQGSNPATGLSVGDWIVDITDSDGCVKTDTITVPNSIEITYTLTPTMVSCNGACNGSIETNAAGIAPLTYQWNMNGNPMAGETNPDIFNLCPGTYNLEISDAAGCTITTTPNVTITEPAVLTDALVDLAHPLCSLDCNGTIEIAIAGGTAPYSINWFNGANVLIGQSDTLATGLCSGDYYAKITDANGCSVTTPVYTLIDPPAFVVNLTSVENSCFGTCDGYIVANTSGGTTPYVWTFTDLLNNNLPNTNIDSTFNLCTGTYVVEVVDANGCTFGPQQVFLQSPSEITANTFSNDATCGLSDGDATVQMLTGDAPFTYQWMDATITPLAGETALTISNIPAGSYFVEVMDANSCSEQFIVNVSNPSATTIIWDSIINPTCNGDCDGAIQITATAITPPLSYLWNPGGITAEDPTGLCAGNYSVQLTDAVGCINFYDTTLVDAPLIQTNFNIADPTCGMCDGTIASNVSGGVTPLNLNWSNGDTGPNTDSICAGVYDLVVLDARGCKIIFNTTVSNPNGLTGLGSSINPETCFGTCDGSISINPAGIAAPFTVFWLHDGSNANSLTNLCAGSYFVQVADSNDCIQTEELIINSPTEITATATINPPTCGNADGSITANSSGGALPHTYSWGSGETTQGIINRAAGIYILTITDANGCTEDITVALSNLNGPTVALDSASISCFGMCDGQLNATATNGTPGYSYIWLNAGGVAIGQTDSFALNLCEGNYFVQVTDASGCISFGNSIVKDVDTLILSLPIETDISCFGACDGQINFIVSGGTQPYSYNWNDPGNSTDLSALNLCAGTYTVTIADANGCGLVDSATVIEPSEIVIATDSITDATCVNSPDGAIYNSVSGGTPGYTYSWTSEDGLFADTNLIITGLFPQNYYLVVTDASGCQAFDTVSVDTSLVLIASAGNDTIICDQTQLILNGIVTSSGVVSLQWTDSLGNVISDSLSMTDMPPVGTTMYVFTASQGVCTDSDTIFVTVAAPFTVDAGVNIQILLGQSGTIGGTPTGPDSVAFAWSPSYFLNDSTAANPNVILPQQTMVYYVYGTDTNGCVYSDSVIVEVIPDIIIINGFTPNGDGVNDTWELDFAIYFPDIEVFVFNRWGEELFRSSGYAVPWDGRFKGKNLPVGTYYYIIQLNDNKYPDPFSGPLTIMR